MKVSTLLKKATKVSSEDAARDLRYALCNAISSTAALKDAETQNPDSYFANDDLSAHASLEISNLLSEDYGICAKVAIDRNDDGGYDLCVRVCKVHFLDGRGEDSRNYEYDESSEDEFTADPGDSVARIAKQIRNLMIRQHASLIQSVGVSSYKQAYATAKKCF